MRAALDMYDDMPKYMRKYLQNYGWHFNKALCSYAISFMKKGGKSLEPVSKEYIDKVLTQNNIKLEKIMLDMIMYLLAICIRLITTEVV